MKISNLISFLVLLISWGIQAEEVECPDFSGLKKITEPAADASIRDWAEYQSIRWVAWRRAGEQVFERYMEGLLVEGELEQCISTESDHRVFRNLLPQIFYNQSLERLRRGQSESIRALLRLIEERSKHDRLILFRLVGHFKDMTPPTDAPGGVHRGTGSLFMNFSKIDPDEWLIILVHELLHGIDQRLASSIGEYSNPELTTRLAASKASQIEDLPVELRTQLTGWLMAGLDRGFLAEYRAWTATLRIYQDGVSDGLWKKIDWAEKFLAQRRPGESLSELTFRVLDPQFIDPSEGIFSLPLVSLALKNVRHQLQSAKNPPSLFNLEPIVSAEANI